ncbi:VOC family protein [Streptomyces sp. JNUCC 64]
MQRQMFFVNLPVSDLEASKRFYTGLGYALNPTFSDEHTACVVVHDALVVMLLDHERYATFAKKEIADAHRTSQVLLGLSAESRAAVDTLVDTALTGGGSPAGDTQDHGFMYGRSFDDPDGHTWEVIWMDESAL